MFLGHFGLAMAAKKAAPKTCLGTFLFATQFADLFWPIFLLMGLERVRIVPGIMRMNSLDFVRYPITHSLVAQLGWGVALGLFYFALRRNAKSAAILGACVVSHWFLDLVVHRPDLPVWPGGLLVGLGLWNSVPATLVVELGLFLFGLAVYLRATHAADRVGTYALWSLLVLLVVVWLGAVFGPPPPNERILAYTSLSIWLTVPWITWADRHRES